MASMPAFALTRRAILHFKPKLPVLILCQSYRPPSACMRNASGRQIRNASPKADWWRNLHAERSGRRQKAAKEACSSGALRLEPTALACAPMLVRAFQSPNKQC